MSAGAPDRPSRITERNTAVKQPVANSLATGGEVGYKGTMQKWKYLRDEAENEEEMDGKLSDLGGLGWELVSVCYKPVEDSFALTGEAATPSPWKLFFKQPAV
jgi:hypothetical protein